jgi:hypothetical protein
VAQQFVKWGFPRAAGAVPFLLEFLVVAVATVLVTRFILAILGFPQLGGGGLHVAHVLWGGLLMALGVMMLLSFVGPLVRPVGSFIAGVGFGLFIDEVGKFLTSNNDYFFRPALAVMYVTIILLVLVVQWIHGRRPLSPPELFIAALTAAAVGVTRGITPAERAQAIRRLDAAGDLPGAVEATAVVRALPEATRGRFNFSSLVGRMMARLRRIFRSKVAERLTVAIMVIQATLTLLTAALLGVGALLRALGVEGIVLETGDRVPAIISGTAAVASAICVVVGIVRLRRRRRASGYRWLQRAVLIDLLLTRVFEFAVNQFWTIPSVILDLVLLAVLALARADELDENGAASAPSATSTPDRMPADAARLA